MNWKPSDAFDYAKGNLDPSREENFRAAMEEQPELLRSVENAQRILNLGSDAIEASESIHLRRVLHEITTQEDKTMGPASFRWFVPALALLCISVISAVLLVSQEPTHSPLWAFQPPPTETESDKKVWLPLADGSSVGPSKLAVWSLVQQNSEGLTLELSAGTLDCKVTKKPEGQEFRVKAHGVEVSVVGTEFAVEANRDGAVTVSVTEGVVGVSHKGFEGNLEAGQSWSTQGGLASKKSKGAGSTVQETPAPPESPPVEVASPVETDDTPEEKKADTNSIHVQEPTKATTGGTPAKKLKQETAKPKVKGPTPIVPTEGNSETVENQPEDSGDTIEINLPHQSQQKPIEVANNQAKAPTGEAVKKAAQSKNVGAISALAKMQAGNYDEALRDLKGLQGKNVQHRADLLYLRGYCHHKKGEVAMARTLWTKMDELDPNNPWLPKVGNWLNPPKPSAGQLR
jgi:ferric-dicitrate binding protein FerR (iron transport regulator)